jgi:hypothetical protein
VDQNYYWSLLAAFIGVASGFQGIYEKYRKDSFVGAATFPGFLYLLSRGAVPGATFALLYGTGVVSTQPWEWALACGTGSEVLLRSNFFIKKADPPRPNAQGGSTPPQTSDVMIGPLDLLKWWQELALSGIGTCLSGKRLRFVDRHMPPIGDFPQFCKLVKDRLASLQDQTVAETLCKQIDTLAGEYSNDGAPIAEHYRIGLGLLLERSLSRREFISVVPRA